MITKKKRSLDFDLEGFLSENIKLRLTDEGIKNTHFALAKNTKKYLFSKENIVGLLFYKQEIYIVLKGNIRTKHIRDICSYKLLDNDFYFFLDVEEKEEEYSKELFWKNINNIFESIDSNVALITTKTARTLGNFDSGKIKKVIDSILDELEK